MAQVNPTNQPNKRVKLGQPIQHTDKQLDALSHVSAADIENAKLFWRKYAPKKFKTILDAQPVDLEK